MLKICFNMLWNISEPIIQIEIAEDRNVLYTRSEQGSIQVYDLGEDGQASTFVTELSHTSITKSASQIIK